MAAAQQDQTRSSTFLKKTCRQRGYKHFDIRTWLSQEVATRKFAFGLKQSELIPSEGELGTCDATGVKKNTQ